MPNVYPLDTPPSSIDNSPVNEIASCGSHPCPVSLSLIEAARTLEMQLEQALAPHQLSLAKFGVLRCLMDEARALPLSAIAQRQRCVRSNMTQLTDRLEADGLVRRVDDPSDRRAVLAEATDAGRAAYAAAEAALRAEEERFLQGLSCEERSHMTELVKRFVQQEATA
jgi:DNA-binding MarR family transcriptional regulator